MFDGLEVCFGCMGTVSMISGCFRRSKKVGRVKVLVPW